MFEYRQIQDLGSFSSFCPWALICLSLCSIDLNCSGQLYLQIDDIHNESQFFYGGNFFNKNHAKDILNFVNSHKDHVGFFLIVCQNGNCSSAISSALSHIYQGTRIDFTKQLFNIQVYRQMLRHYYSFN